MFANNRGGAIVLLLANFALVLLTSSLLLWSFLLLLFLSLSLEPSQNTLHIIKGPQNYQFRVKAYVQPPF